MWLLWGNIGPYRKGTTTVSYLYCMERRNFSQGFFLQCKCTYFMVQFDCFGKANKNFKFLSDNQTYYKWCYISICWRCWWKDTILMVQNNMWCVTLAPVRFYVLNVNNRNIRRPEISNLKMRIPQQYQLMFFWCCHC